MKTSYCNFTKYRPIFKILSPADSTANLYQGHREFPFWKLKIAPPSLTIPENSRSQKHYSFGIFKYIGLVLALYVYLNTAAAVVCLLRIVENNYIAL